MTLIITLLLVGAALMFLEVFLPGLVAGALGLLCLVAAVVLGYAEGFFTGNVVLGIVIVGLVLGTWCWLKFFPESRIAGLFISKQAIGDLGTDRPELVGHTGEAITALRPSGTAVLDGKRVDVVAESGFIERGTSVKVVAVEGLRVVVRAV